MTQRMDGSPAPAATPGLPAPPMSSGRLFLIAAGYYLSIQIGFSSIAKSAGISILWPPTGFLLGILLTHNPRLWPRIMLTCIPIDFAANLVFNTGGIPFALLTAMVDGLEALMAAGSVRIVLRRDIRLDNPHEVLWLVFLVTPAIFVTSLAGSAIAVAWGSTPSFWPSAGIWFLSGWLGIVIVTPVFLTWNKEHLSQIRSLSPARAAELGLLVVGLIGWSLFLFASSPEGGPSHWISLPYLVFPFIIGLCLRFNPLVASSASAVTGLIAAWYTLRGSGPFSMMAASDAQRAILVQTFAAVVSLAALMLGSVIAQRRKTEAALRSSEERLELALRGADLGMWDWSIPTGNLAYRASWLSHLGYTSAEFESRLDFSISLVHPDDLAGLNQAVKDHLEGKTPALEAEFRFRAKSGDWVWLLMRGMVVERDKDGQPLRAVGTHLDLTPRKRIEEEKERLQEQFLQAQKMEIVGRLAGGVAHDLNNLLTPIIGYTEMALWVVDPKDPLYVNLEQVVQAGHRAKDLTRRLLAFGRKQILEITTVDLNGLVAGFVKILRRTIREDIEIQVELGPSPGIVRADPSQIEQVLMNLAVNSQDAMPRGGRLIIRTGVVELDAGAGGPPPPGRYQLLEVEDTGVGMDADTLSHLFEPFFTTKEVGKGTGLGLATIYGIVRQHGGQVAVHSEPGNGTRFSVYFPSGDDTGERAAAVQRPGPAAPGQGTLLVVEDDAAVRSLLCRMLSQLGYEVIESARPLDALGIGDNFTAPIDLLITDVIMPQMNGCDLYRKLAERRPHLKVLYMSGYSGRAIAEQEALQEIGCLIQKPFAISTLTDKVRELLSSGAEERL